jgi:hypothetical protein
MQNEKLAVNINGFPGVCPDLNLIKFRPIEGIILFLENFSFTNRGHQYEFENFGNSERVLGAVSVFLVAVQMKK